ncbi:hypothetical protein R3W88_031563 [Solanum pinnatisectum]|uniref:Uncharacterized protein n=1 Tax=Solanum pinnatisectum TaxID=50273 RepID=A0AAV9LLN7_9SOLN|nr:hypothetical protein R3W88_031563 [Solanum pinnatisectum]
MTTIGLFACFIILLCFLAILTSMAYEESHVSIGENNKFGIKTKHSIGDVTKVQRGRAPYGGADLLRRPRPNKNSAIYLKQPSMFTSTTNIILILCSFLLVLLLL